MWVPIPAVPANSCIKPRLPITAIMSARPLLIGLSANIYHPLPGATGLRSKSLQYLEQSLAHWVMSQKAMVFIIPSVGDDGVGVRGSLHLADYAHYLDALVLQGGADISPKCYGEVAQCPDWSGDYLHDTYQMELLNGFMAAGKPVLGICRGAQLINVALGGSLYQDLATQYDRPSTHVHPDFDKFAHAVEWRKTSGLAKLYPEQNGGRVVSVHHQAIKVLGDGLSIEAQSPDDGVIEAIRLRGKPYVLGLQWHPEFHQARSNPLLLDCNPILADFLNAAREVRLSQG